MASNIIVMERTASGKKGARKLRYDGYVPGIIYGDNREPVLVSVGEKELVAECYSSAFLGHIIEAKIGSNIEKFLPKQIEFDPVTDRPVHIDFLRVSKNAKVKVSIAIEFINEDKCPGLKKGGIVNVVVHKLDCFCSPESIPEKLTIDLSGKDIGHGFMLEQMELPEGVTPVNAERDAVLATIVATKMEEEEVASEATVATTETATSTTTDKKPA